MDFRLKTVEPALLLLIETGRKKPTQEIHIKTFTELYEIIEHLNKYRVDRFSLFPGLDRLAAHIEWLQSRGY